MKVVAVAGTIPMVEERLEVHSNATVLMLE